MSKQSDSIEFKNNAMTVEKGEIFDTKEGGSFYFIGVDIERATMQATPILLSFRK